MDMMPPQAPPALTQSTYEEATRAFDRLTDLQAWLATEQAGMPAFPETIGNTPLVTYLADVEAYWQALPTEAAGDLSRRAALIRRLAGAARDLAELAQNDGNLDASTLATVHALVTASAAGLPAHITVRELMFGGTPYAGVLLVQDAQRPERTLVFSTDRGWEVFASLTDVHAEMEQRARRTLVRTPDLPGLARQHTLGIGPEAFVTSRDVVADPFAVLVDRLIDVQRDRLHQAGLEFDLADDDTLRTAKLTDDIFDALRLDHAFDVAGLLAVRQASLVEAFNTQRLARVPANVASDWREAEESYLSLLRHLTEGDTASGLPAPLDLPGYARQALTERLRAMGVTQAPAEIQVRIDRSTDLTARLESLQALFEGPAPAHISLLDLAYQNIAAFDPVRLTATAGDGSAIAGLADAPLRRLVRELNLATRYRDYVETTFRTGEHATMRREQAAGIQAAHMRLQAAEARLSYYLTGEPRSFLADRAERGYQWIKAVLDAPRSADRARVEGHDIVVSQMTYQDTPLRDVLAIGVRRPGSVRSVVLYTPDAPDGITFREFNDRAEAGRRFFYNPAFREYLLDRLPADHARLLPNGSARAFAGDQLAHWVLGSGASSGYTLTAAPFEEREIAGDVLAAAYDVDVQLSLRNAHTFTRSAEQANWRWLVDVWRTTMSNHMVESMIEGVVTAPARAAQAAWRLYDNVKAGNNAEAVVDFADFYNASLMAAAPVHSFSTGSIARGIVGARFRAAGRLVEARPAAPSAVTFEPRFMARNVRKTGQANREGILAIKGKTYIEHDGQLYAVRYDADYATWRLARPGAALTFRGPAIQRSSSGYWGYHRVGLRGGSGRGPGGAPARPDVFDAYADEVERAFPDSFERDMVGMHIQQERAGAGPSTAITAAQRLRWNEAFARARQRERASRARPTPPTTAPADLRRGGDYVPVPRADVPAELWYYDRLPVKDSGVQVTRDAIRSRNMAEIRSSLIGQGMHGVRLTTLPPTAPLEQIRNAMGRQDLTRTGTFAVRIDTASFYGPLYYAWRSRLPFVHDVQAEVLRVGRAPANVFIARPTSWATNALYLGNGQYHIQRGLPAPTGP